MLTRIEATTPRGVILDLPLDDSSTGLLITNVEGLGPVKATISSSNFAQLDGADYQSARREVRNIILSIALEPDWANESVSDLRDRVYNFFMPKSLVDLRFYTTNKNPLWTQGYVESAEPELFTAEPTIAVSIMCFNPDFYDQMPVMISGMTSTSTTFTDVDYAGSVASGIRLEIMPNRALTDFSIYLNDSQLDFTGALQAGDNLQITTEPGFKSVRLLRAGSETSYLHGVTPQSDWVRFEQGSNKIRVHATGAAIPYNVYYVNRYGGL